MAFPAFVALKVCRFFTDFKVMILRKNILLKSLLFVLFAITFVSCQSTPKSDDEETVTIPSEETETETPEAPAPQITVSRRIADKGQLTATQLADFFLLQRPDYDYIEIVHFAQYYIVEAAAEGINSDVAFAQMCLETGYLRFGGLVQPDFHNYCGLGAMDAENPGCIFETEQLGVRAHIQHLQAYATHEDELLNNELIDPRYNWVHKTKYIETIDGLAGTWATDPNYAIKIESILSRMEEMVN